MNTIKTIFVASCVPLLACGGPPSVDEHDGEPLDDYCMATFTRDMDVGGIKYSVKKGERFLLTKLEFSPTIAILKESGFIDLLLGEDGVAAVDAPCLADGVEVSVERVALADIEVFADMALTELVCEIPRLDRGEEVSFGGEAVGTDPSYNYIYKVHLGDGFCDGLAEGYILAEVIEQNGAEFVNFPVTRLFRPVP